MILYDSNYQPHIFHSQNYETDAKSVYAEYFKKQFTPIEKVLTETYKNQNFRHATENDEFNKVLAENNLNLETLRDPWQQPYRAVFETVKTEDIVKIVSAGADKKFDTSDDFIVSSSSFTYFTPTGQKIDEAIKNYHERTGRPTERRNHIQITYCYMKRDAGLNKGDQLKITIDTFHDHRNAFYFSTNPLGAYKDANTVENGRTINYDWNAVWNNKTSIDDSGWYIESRSRSASCASRRRSASRRGA